MPLLSTLDRVARIDPVNREVVVRVSELRASFAGVWTLAGILISIPSRGSELCQFAFQGRERRIDELGQEPLLELCLTKARAGIPLRGSGTGSNKSTSSPHV